MTSSCLVRFNRLGNQFILAFGRKKIGSCNAMGWNGMDVGGEGCLSNEIIGCVLQGVKSWSTARVKKISIAEVHLLVVLWLVMAQGATRRPSVLEEVLVSLFRHRRLGDASSCDGVHAEPVILDADGRARKKYELSGVLGYQGYEVGERRLAH